MINNYSQFLELYNNDNSNLTVPNKIKNIISILNIDELSYIVNDIKLNNINNILTYNINQYINNNNIIINNNNNNNNILSLCTQQEIIENTTKPTDNKEVIVEFEENIFGTFPTFIQSPNYIKIPTKVQRVIENYIPKHMLKEIDSNIEVSKELILIFLNKLLIINPDDEEKYINISKRYLSKSLFGNELPYNVKKADKIISVCLYELKNGAIIECDNKYISTRKSFGYRLSSTYKLKGIINYEFKTEKVKELHKKHYYYKLSKSLKSNIVRNLFTVYSKITLPSEETLLTEAKRLIKENYKTKKGKILTFRNKKSSKLDNTEKYSYVEDNIKIFKYYTEGGYMIPTISQEYYRITDSFTQLPSWIRNLCKIDGRRIVECDYSALHPNIAVMLYSGHTEYITHNLISETIDIDLKTVKKQHLTLFNMDIKQMVHTKIFDFYKQYEPEMIERIITDKKLNGQKNITKELFKIEVEIMSKAIDKLNNENIFVGYIYDALFTSPKNKERVIEVMNETIIEFNVKTQAK